MQPVRAIETCASAIRRPAAASRDGTETAISGEVWIGWTDREVVRSPSGPPRVLGSSHGARLLELLDRA